MRAQFRREGVGRLGQSNINSLHALYLFSFDIGFLRKDITDLHFRWYKSIASDRNFC